MFKHPVEAKLNPLLQMFWITKGDFSVEIHKTGKLFQNFLVLLSIDYSMTHSTVLGRPKLNFGGSLSFESTLLRKPENFGF